MSRRIGLRSRFLLLILSLLIVLFGALATLLVVRKASSERSNLNEQSKSFATLATKPIGDAFLLYKDSGLVRIQQQVAKFTDLNKDITGVSIVDTSGKTIFNSGEKPKFTKEQAGTFTPIYQSKNGTIKEVIVPLLEDYGIHRYSVIYSVSDERLINDIQRTVATIIILCVIGFIVALLLTYWLLNAFFISPVSTISAKAIRISQGNLEDQIELQRNDELGDLATSVNTMANSLKADIVKLQEADKLKSEFITISSHNLRTPLTTIKGNLEFMRDMDVPEEFKNMISALSASTSRLDNFIEDLLAISSMESGKLAMSDLKAGPVGKLLEGIAGEYVEVAKQQKLVFNSDIQLKDEQVVMSMHLLKMALVNLLENAFKFTKEGSVSLTAAVEAGKVVIRVSDTGIGIAAAEMPKLFTKFHRGTSVMQYDYEGTGIGLYLTKLIITDHNGTISAESLEGKGATFIVTLPLAG